MGELLPFRRELREPQAPVLACRCPIAHGRFVAQPGCPVHGSTTGTLVTSVAVQAGGED